MKPRLLMRALVIEKDKQTQKEIRRYYVYGCYDCKKKFEDKKLLENHKCSITSLENGAPGKPLQ